MKRFIFIAMVGVLKAYPSQPPSHLTKFKQEAKQRFHDRYEHFFNKKREYSAGEFVSALVDNTWSPLAFGAAGVYALTQQLVIAHKNKKEFAQSASGE